MTIQFHDKMVSYETFLDDLASRITRQLLQAQADPEVISQRKAYAIFGRANVDRWRKQGRVSPCKRVGKVEYRTADLRMCQQVRQDYFVS